MIPQNTHTTDRDLVLIIMSFLALVAIAVTPRAAYSPAEAIIVGCFLINFVLVFMLGLIVEIRTSRRSPS